MTSRPIGQPLPFQPGKPIGNVYYGSCSWTDRTLIDAGTFYPASARTAADRLTYYASQFPIVEVDATYYALPSERCARAAHYDRGQPCLHVGDPHRRGANDRHSHTAPAY